MKHRWVASANRHDNLNTSTTHLVLTFTHSLVMKDKKYDTYSPVFEIHFQANINGKDILDPGKHITPSEWYAPTFKNIKATNIQLACKAMKEISKGSLDPKEVLKSLNACLVKQSNDCDYWIKEWQPDIAQLLSPKEMNS